MEITLRVQFGVSSPNDLVLPIKDNTHDYLMTSNVETIRVSAYLEQNIAHVAAKYAELFVQEDCPARYRIVRVTPGSRARKKIQLPGEMLEGEQITIEVKRVGAAPAAIDP